MSLARVLARNIFSNWTYLSVSSVIGFFMMPFMIFRLGDSLYGIWVLVVSIVGYGSLLDFGIRSSIVKYVSQHHATNNRDRLLDLFNTTLAVYTGIGALIFALTIIATFFISYIFQIPPEFIEEARLVLLIVGVNLALKFPAGVFEGFLTGLQRYEITNGIAIGASLLRASLTVVLLLQGKKLLALAAIGLVSDLLMSLVMAVVCLRLIPWLALKGRYLKRRVLREIYTYGLWSSVIVLGSKVLYDSDAILIGAFLPTASITHFAVANTLVRYLRQLVSGFGNVFTPVASDLEARSEQERLARLLTHGTRYALVVVLPVVVLLALVGREFLALWMGPRYAAESGHVLIILVLSQAIGMAQFPAGAMLYGLNRHWLLALMVMGEAVAKVLISIILIPHYGILGVAIGTGIADMAASALLAPVVITRCVGVPLGAYIREAFIPPAIGGLVLAASIVALNGIFLGETWILLLGKIMSGVIIYLLVCFFTCFGCEQRHAGVSFFSRMLKKPFSSKPLKNEPFM